MLIYFFWTAILLIFYTYFGYPLILCLLSLITGKSNNVDMTHLPKITMIIAAYNEEKAIGKKLQETLSLDYPKDRLEIIVASDGSSDKTDMIVRGFSHQGVILIRKEPRGGKTAAQNEARKDARGEILVFSDATTVYESCTIRELVKHFKDEKVGCVAGREVFIQDGKDVSQQAGFFWRYELFLRKKESDIFSLIGVSGCVFAIRQELYNKLPDGLIEDFALPLKVSSEGYKVVYEPMAIAYEEAAKNIKNEFFRKARIVSGGINVLVTMRYLLNPFKYPQLSFFLFSHKICRWFVPICMVTVLAANPFIVDNGAAYSAIMAGQIFFYLISFLSFLLQNRVKLPKIAKIFLHFSIMNFSALLGLYKFLFEENKAIWEPVRE